MNQPSGTNPNPSPYNNVRLATASGECGNCGSQKRWILHNVRIRGIHRRLCTTCVLRLHSSSYCPSCFEFYDSTNIPPSSKRLTCSKCSSFTHLHCAQQPASSSSSSSANTTSLSSSASYLCSACVSPNSSLFDIDSDPKRAIDKRLALILLCAAKISAASMHKAVIVARAEAERRVREAALARKRAREALDNLAILVHSRGDKNVRKDVFEGSAEVSGSANPLQKQKEKNPVAAPPNSQARQMFNGFAAPKDKSGNGELKPAIDRRPTLQSNGNLNEKDKSGNVDVDKEKVKLEPKP